MQILLKRSKYIFMLLTSITFLLVWNKGGVEDVTSVPFASDFWGTLAHELTMDHHADSRQVQSEIKKLLADRDNLNKILRAAAPYIYFIHHETKARDLPAELALIPAIESEFNPNDHSNKGATGLWQLMPRTAQELGVKVKSGYDGRRNVIASTNAALAYFNDLGNEFNGDWYLAIAAYNSGQVRVEHAIRHAGTKDFWELLSLPQETKLYVPKLLAIAEIIKNPQQYNVELPPVENKPYFTEVKVKKSVNLTKVAESSGVNIKTLKVLNPDYKQETVPATKEGSTLLVPVNKAKAVKTVVSN